jgi:serine/threonine-protein kinase
MAEDALIGQLLGDYRVEECIGAGAMGVVYRAVQPLIGKHVAVKVLRPEVARSAGDLQRLLLEARTVNAVGHRGVIDVFGFGETPDGRQYFLMEHLAGQPLDRLLGERAPLPPLEAIGILDELLDALGAIHQAGVIHRDLKPSNIYLVAQRGGPPFLKILDFGIAKVAAEPPGALPEAFAEHTVQQTTIAGTPEFMAPELVQGGLLSARSDLYAVGVTAFQMLTGELPYRSSSITECIQLHLRAPVPAPSSVNAAVPGAIDAWVKRLLAKSPEARPASAEVARRELQQVRRQLTASEVPLGPAKPGWRQALVGTSLLLAACATAALILRTMRASELVEPLMVPQPPERTDFAPPEAPLSPPPLIAAPAPPNARVPKKSAEVGTLTIRARQYSTSFQVDGREWGGQPAGRTFEGIRAGKHHLLIRQNAKRFERDVVVEPGGSAVVEVVFR